MFICQKICKALGAEYEAEHMVSYLPLSHIAGQMDLYMCITSAIAIHFAQPDALKVNPLCYTFNNLSEALTNSVSVGLCYCTLYKRRIRSLRFSFVCFFPF